MKKDIGMQIDCWTGRKCKKFLKVKAVRKFRRMCKVLKEESPKKYYFSGWVS